ncbi:MAG: hypothetical protein ABI639_11410 [Thermoanaerobaculia bacterium]
MDFIAPMTVMVVLILMIGTVARQLIVNRRQREALRINAELQAKLLDRITATGDLQAYLASDSGRRFVDAATVERTDPHAKVLASVQSGILLIAVGCALQMSRNFAGDEGRDAMHLFGTLGLVVGIGFLVSAAAVFTLSKRWGLLETPSRDEAAAAD